MIFSVIKNDLFLQQPLTIFFKDDSSFDECDNKELKNEALEVQKCLFHSQPSFDFSTCCERYFLVFYTSRVERARYMMGFQANKKLLLMAKNRVHTSSL